MVIETIVYISIAFFIGMLIGLWYYEGYIKRVHRRCAELECRCDEYKKKYFDMRFLIHRMSKKEVELLQKDYATFVILKDVDLDCMRVTDEDIIEWDEITKIE